MVPPAATWIAGERLAFDAAPYFLSPAGMPLEYRMVAKEALFTATANDDGLLIVTPHRHGGGPGRLHATVAGHPEAGKATLEFYVLVHPEAHPLVDGFFAFSEWSPEAPAGAMPGGLLFLQSETSDPAVDTPMPHGSSVDHEISWNGPKFGSIRASIRRRPRMPTAGDLSHCRRPNPREFSRDWK